MQTIARKNLELKDPCSEMSSELNLSDSLEQKASYIYVEGLQLYQYMKKRKPKSQSHGHHIKERKTDPL